MSIGDKLKNLMHGGKREWAEDARFRERHLASGGTAQDYDRYRPAYQYGYLAGNEPSYRGRKFDEVESELRTGWGNDFSSQSGDWNAVRGHVGTAFREAQEALITRSEEELAIGKRQVRAGEVEVRKSVETEHVRQQVPVTHEEVSIERRPVNDVRADATIGEDSIRVPVSKEELVVDKRAVAKEEIVVRKHAVQDTENVEADLRKERVDIDDRTRTKGRTDDDLRDGSRR